MKYIRTKDNLYEIESTFVDYKGKTIYQTVKNGLIDETEIVKVGDEIGKLCDEFIYHYIKENRYEVYKELSTIPFLDREIIKNGNEIIGAIWTDKGLIYKAKMNEKGELELL